MSNQNRIVGAEANRPRDGKASYTLRTDAGVLVRVSAGLYRQVIDAHCQPIYLHMLLSNEPLSNEDAIVVCADVIELETRLAKVKKEAAELSRKLAEIAG